MISIRGLATQEIVMRLTVIAWDWKAAFAPQDLAVANEIRAGGREAYFQEFETADVDDKLMCIASQPLTPSQIQALWKQHDKAVGLGIWEGTFEEILEQIGGGRKC